MSDIVIIVIAIIISLVYAGFTGQLTINGTAVGRDSNWDIHFENVSNITTTGSAKVLNNHQPVINSNNRTEINDYEVSLTSPNDTISFTFDAVNDGNYNAKITSLSVGTPECSSTDQASATNMCNNLTYTLTYDSGATVQTNDILYAKDKLSFKVTLKFNDISNPDLLPKAGVSISNLGIQINFEQEGSALVKDDGTVANYRVYHQGDKITLNNEEYYVITNSGADKDYVVALKKNVLPGSIINLYSVEPSVWGHVVPYYFTDMCNYSTRTECHNDYESSNAKLIVDGWVNDNFSDDQLKVVDGYKARLILNSEYSTIPSAYSWRVSNNWYWTMTAASGQTIGGAVGTNGSLTTVLVTGYNNSNNGQIRPVINVYKSALETNNNE